MTARATGAVALGAEDCAVWWATPSDGLDVLALLSEGERARAARFRRPGDRARYATGRALLRAVLADRTGLPAAAVPLTAVCTHCGSREHGKPGVRGPDALRSAVSLAHRGDRVVVALTAGRAVGVDVEAEAGVGAPDGAGVSSEALAPEEWAAHVRLPREERRRAFAVWWARKEAVLKATGHGLAVPPSGVLVSAPGTPAELLAWRAGPGAGDLSPGAAHLKDLAPGAGYVGCVAVLGGTALRVREYDGDAVLRRDGLLVLCREASATVPCGGAVTVSS